MKMRGEVPEGSDLVGFWRVLAEKMVSRCFLWRKHGIFVA